MEARREPLESDGATGVLVGWLPASVEVTVDVRVEVTVSVSVSVTWTQVSKMARFG